MTKPSKPGDLERPFNPPPTPATLARRGHVLMRTRKSASCEDGNEAFARAAAMPWGKRIVRKDPYQASGYWLWVCKQEVAA